MAALLARAVVRIRRVRRRFDVLFRIAEVSDRGGTLSETLDATCAIIVPELADFCMIDLIKGGRVERIAVRVGPGGGQRTVEGLAGRRPSLPEAMEDASEGPPTCRSSPASSSGCRTRDLVGLSHDPEDLEFLRGLGVRSAITVPLRARGQGDRGADASASPGRGGATTGGTSTSPASSPAGWP